MFLQDSNRRKFALKTLKVLRQIAIIGATLCSVGSGQVFAGLITVDLGKNLQQTQVDASGDFANENDYFAARAFYQNAGDYDSATLTWPGPFSPFSMSNVPGTFTFLNGATAAGYFIEQSGSYFNPAILDGDYPQAGYKYDLNDSTNTNPPVSSSIQYSSDLYPANQPTLTAASFNGLQGLNTTQAASVSFGALQDNPAFSSAAGDSDYVFLDVFTAGFGSDVYSTFVQSPGSLNSLLIPANTLTPGTSYSLLLDFDNRIGGSDVNGISQFQLFDVKTEVDFTTAAAVASPEPAGLALAGLGLLALALFARTGTRGCSRIGVSPPLALERRNTVQ
jgi:hypothetical protein